MSPEARLILHEWSSPIFLDLAIAATCFFFVRGWLALRRSSPSLLSVGKLAAFLSGMLCLWVAIGSPLAAFDEASLTVHMIQHILLMLVVPPLVLLGAPAMPLLHGLPQGFVRTPLGPFLRWSPIQSLGHFLTNPMVSWVLAALALLLWHAPASFELALHSDAWHEFEHGCFLFTSILFWWPVMQPFPTEPRWPAWSAPLYLFLGMIPGSVLGAFLAFCDRVVYPSYAEAPKIFAMTPLEDQVLAGLLMWVLGFFVCVVPAVYLTIRLLSPQNLQSADAVNAPQQVIHS
ncbi:MAG: cytochrome c oxidase assembly protein [Candidatus Acidiferrum sp.]